MEARLFDPENKPEWLDSDWWLETDNCNHLDNRVHRARLEASAQTAINAAASVSTAREGDHYITDLGAGDGGLLSLLPAIVPDRSYKAWGYEVITDSVRYANEVRRVDVRHANVLTQYDKLDLARTVVMTEMLEHLEDPGALLTKLLKDSRVWNIVASSPHSETSEHHEWNHAWAWDREGYRDLFERSGWFVEEHFDAEWSQVVWVTLPARVARW